VSSEPLHELSKPSWEYFLNRTVSNTQSLPKYLKLATIQQLV
jgi:hypothetical protein